MGAWHAPSDRHPFEHPGIPGDDEPQIRASWLRVESDRLERLGRRRALDIERRQPELCMFAKAPRPGETGRCHATHPRGECGRHARESFRTRHRDDRSGDLSVEIEVVAARPRVEQALGLRHENFVEHASADEPTLLESVDRVADESLREPGALLEIRLSDRTRMIDE